MIKINELEGCNAPVPDYLPPKVTVIEVEVQSILCSSGGGGESDPFEYGPGGGI